MTENGVPADLVARVRAEVVAADRRARHSRNRQLGRVWNRGIKTGTPGWCRRSRRERGIV